MLQEITIDGQRTQFISFESTGELVTESFQKLRGGRYANSGWDILGHGHWAGAYFSTWQDVLKKTENVWTEGMERYSKMLEKLRELELPKPVNIRRRGVWSEEGGDEIDVDRLRRGVPYWRTTHRDHRPGPVSKTIVTNLSTAAIVRHEDILWRGAAAVCLTELLEQAGYRVELWAANHVRKGYENGDNGLQAVCLKRPSDPLDTSTLVNCVSGWFFRTAIFAAYEQFDRSRTARGHGKPIEHFSSEALSHITPDEQVFQCSEIWNMKAAQQWVAEQLATIQ